MGYLKNIDNHINHVFKIVVLLKCTCLDTLVGKASWRLLSEEVQEHLLEAVRKDKELSQQKIGRVGSAAWREAVEKEETSATIGRHVISVAEMYAFVRALKDRWKASRLLETVALPLTLIGKGGLKEEAAEAAEEEEGGRPSSTTNAFKNGLVTRRYPVDHKALMLVSNYTFESVNAYLNSPFHLVDRPRLMPRRLGAFCKCVFFALHHFLGVLHF